jgi:poly-gamma-glutamate synthase PgsB/CapB
VGSIVIDATWASLSMPLLDQITPLARFIVAIVAGSIACLSLAAGALLHRRRLNRIPIRVHVAGTRGKSAVTRLVAAGLRAGGYRIVAKTTGTQPKLIRPDGSEVPIRRWSAASIREQSSFIRRAAREKADAVVVEAMAIEPEYLGALERFYIRATDLLITNLRPDHQEQLGDRPDAMASAITRAFPPGGRVFATAEAATPLVQGEAQRLSCELIVCDDVRDSDPEAANLMLARAICRRYRIDDKVADAAMRDAQRDIGAFSLQSVTLAGRSVRFANAFSCNDIESFRLLWQRHQPAGIPAAFLFNARADRPLRSRAFLSLLPLLAPDAALYVTQGSRVFQKWAQKAGFDPSRVHLLPLAPAPQQLDRIARDVADGTVVWGTGNFRGAGAEITAFVDAVAQPC